MPASPTCKLLFWSGAPGDSDGLGGVKDRQECVCTEVRFSDILAAKLLEQRMSPSVNNVSEPWATTGTSFELKIVEASKMKVECMILLAPDELEAVRWVDVLNAMLGEDRRERLRDRVGNFARELGPYLSRNYSSSVEEHEQRLKRVFEHFSGPAWRQLEKESEEARGREKEGKDGGTGTAVKAGQVESAGTFSAPPAPSHPPPPLRTSVMEESQGGRRRSSTSTTTGAKEGKKKKKKKKKVRKSNSSSVPSALSSAEALGLALPFDDAQIAALAPPMLPPPSAPGAAGSEAKEAPAQQGGEASAVMLPPSLFMPPPPEAPIPPSLSRMAMPPPPPPSPPRPSNLLPIEGKEREAVAPPLFHLAGAGVGVQSFSQAGSTRSRSSSRASAQSIQERTASLLKNGSLPIAFAPPGEAAEAEAIAPLPSLSSMGTGSESVEGDTVEAGTHSRATFSAAAGPAAGSRAAPPPPPSDIGTMDTATLAPPGPPPTTFDNEAGIVPLSVGALPPPPPL